MIHSSSASSTLACLSYTVHSTQQTQVKRHENLQSPGHITLTAQAHSQPAVEYSTCWPRALLCAASCTNTCQAGQQPAGRAASHCTLLQLVSSRRTPTPNMGPAALHGGWHTFPTPSKDCIASTSHWLSMHRCHTILRQIDQHASVGGPTLLQFLCRWALLSPWPIQPPFPSRWAPQALSPKPNLWHSSYRRCGTPYV